MLSRSSFFLRETVQDAAETKPSTIHFIACSVERTTDHESKPQLLVIPQIKVKPGSNGSRPQILLVIVFQTSIKKTIGRLHSTPISQQLSSVPVSHTARIFQLDVSSCLKDGNGTPHFAYALKYNNFCFCKAEPIISVDIYPTPFEWY